MNQNVDFAKCHPSQVRSGQTLYFKPNFQRDWKYLDFAKFHPSQVWSGQKSIFWARFSTQIKIFLDFVKFHSLLVQSGQHSHFLAKFAAKTENFWILPNFILCMSRVVKTLNFGLDFDCNWKFLNFTTFHPLLHVQSGQKCQLWAKFLTWIKISWFCKISSFAGQEWSKSRLQAKFSTRLKISGFCHNYFILRRSGVVKNLIFEPNIQHKSKLFWILSNFILCWFRVGNTLIFEPSFNTTENFWIVPNFILCMSRVVELLILGLILIAIENFWILPHFILCMSRVVKNVCF